MVRTGAGRGRVKFGDMFFRWLQDQILMFEDYAYASMDFTGDPDLPLPLVASGAISVRSKKP